MSARGSARLRIAFRWAHAIWATLAGGLCLLLIFSGGGHPPPIILLPFVLPVWILGHAALWLARRVVVAVREKR